MSYQFDYEEHCRIAREVLFPKINDIFWETADAQRRDEISFHEEALKNLKALDRSNLLRNLSMTFNYSSPMFVKMNAVAAKLFSRHSFYDASEVSQLTFGPTNDQYLYWRIYASFRPTFKSCGGIEGKVSSDEFLRLYEES